jgi:3-hydroxy acid dehydrogenase / malonic semialdehyde reductase
MKQKANMPRPKKILITGASSGIGQATALMLAQKGHDVLMAARRLDRLAHTAVMSPSITGSLSIGAIDVANPLSIDEFCVKHSEWLSQIDVLINNAGLALGRESFQTSNFSEVQTMIDTNVSGLLRLTHRILPIMIERERGHIVNLGSVAGRAAYAGGTVYCATKAAVHMLSESLRHDLGGTNIRVSVIAPGRVAETEFSEVRFRGDQKLAQKVYEGYRVMTSKDVAETIAWVLDRPDHINIQEVTLMPTDQPSATTLSPYSAGS